MEAPILSDLEFQLFQAIRTQGPGWFEDIVEDTYDNGLALMSLEAKGLVQIKLGDAGHARMCWVSTCS
jgi:hypothetical protein